MFAFQVITGSFPTGDHPGKSARARRVVLLLVAIAIMSMADLVMTIEYATSVGLFEGNPIARAVMAYGSTALLAFWKIASVSLCLWILYRTRFARSAELASWICVAALSWLSFCWCGYNATMAEIAAAAPVVGLEVPSDRPLVTMAQ